MAQRHCKCGRTAFGGKTGQPFICSGCYNPMKNCNPATCGKRTASFDTRSVVSAVNQMARELGI